ncbi:MAG: hypothetical protein Q9227_005998 [Pyrenula ochraceoflavens]
MDIMEPTNPHPSPFASLRSSLLTAFHPQSTPSSTPTSSPSTSPSSSPFHTFYARHRSPTAATKINPTFRNSAFSTTSSTSSRSRSLSPQTMHSYRHNNHPRLLRRRPSAVDMQLEEERLTALNSHAEMAGLALLEPRPVERLPVSVGGGRIWDGFGFEAEGEEGEREDGRGTVVMGGIFEVMEGRV